MTEDAIAVVGHISREMARRGGKESQEEVKHVGKKEGEKRRQTKDGELDGRLGRRTLRRVVTSHCLIRRGAESQTSCLLYLRWLQLPRSIYQGQCKQ